MKTINAIIVEPGRPPRAAEIPDTLEAKQHIVDGYIESVPIADDVSLYCNEEGKLNGLPLNRALHDRNGDIYEIIAGTFLITGYNPSTGEDESLNDEQTEHYTRMFTHSETFALTDTHIIVQ
ncbi:DUF3846 domain-containing protein [Bifidobacterium callimiconis]|uniref:Antirestriction protein n=1 Tax=Bifidobacterium callimiconis TaxID=2306973 RepID=A0A430FBQ3_9BIFI|nr:DUF3846 domain-containing protein [Bifidobacterium callimiconis]RSX50260.1 antirestriction protein [Bifidobacterium callimiconis]